MSHRLAFAILGAAIGASPLYAQSASQPLVLSTVAGSPRSCALVDGRGDAARFCGPTRVAVDGAGNIYVGDFLNKVIRKIDGHGVVTTLTRVADESGLVPAGPEAMTADSAGNVYWANSGGIYKRSPNGTINPISTSGTFGFERAALAIDPSGNLYLARPCLVLKIAPGDIVSTLAGGTCGTGDGTGAAARFSRDLYDMVIDPSGNVYVAEFDNGTAVPGVVEDKIRKITRSGVVTTLARVAPPWPIDVVSATRTSGYFAGGIAVDLNGNVYFSASACWQGDLQDGNLRQRISACDATIRKITPGGTITTVAGYPGDRATVDGTGQAARFSTPSGIAIDPSGHLIVADSAASLIRKITPGAVVTTVAGRRTLTSGFNGAPAAWDAAGNLYGVGESLVTRTSGADGQATAVAGLSFDGGPLAGLPATRFDGIGADARFFGPSGLVTDLSGNVYLADAYGVRRIAPDGTVTTVAAATAAVTPVRLAIDDFGNIYATIKDSTTTPATFFVSQLTSSGLVATNVLSTNNTFTPRRVPAITGLGLATFAKSMYVSDGNAIYLIENDQNHRRSLIAGHPTETGTADGPGPAARFWEPGSIAVDTGGRIFVSDNAQCTVRVIHSSYQVDTIATNACGELFADRSGNVYVVGNRDWLKMRFGATPPTAGWNAQVAAARNNNYADGTGAAARFSYPVSPAVDVNGNVYVIDRGMVRRVTPSGVVSTLAGEWAANGSADGAGAAARFFEPGGLAVDGGGTVFVADTRNHTIRKVSPAGVVSTFAGAVGREGNTDGVGSAARFTRPELIAADAGGTAYVAVNGAVRKIDLQGVVTTLAGSSTALGYADAMGVAARFGELTAITVDQAGNVYVVDAGFGSGTRGRTIRKISTNGVVTTIAGSPTESTYLNGPVSDARFLGGGSIAVDASGNVYVEDACTIRKLTPAGQVTSVVGTPPKFSSEWVTYCGYVDAAAHRARLGSPSGVAVDAAGNLWIADATFTVIRKGVAAVAPTFTSHPANAAARAGQTVTFTVAATGSPIISYQWQRSTDGGTSWADLFNNATYDGATTTTLTATAPSSHTGLLRFRCVADNGTTPATSQAASLTVVSPLSATPASLQFGATKAAGSATLNAVTPAQQLAIVLASGSGPWTVTMSPAWLQLTGGSGVTSGTMTASVVNPGDVIGDNTALASAIILSSTTAPSMPLSIPVTLTVTRPSLSVLPFGSFDTPAAGADVAGSIPVTGWALDDIGVARVEIWRDRAAGETTPVFTGSGPGNGKIYIADPVFVTGARPDIESGFPALPFANRAGWGYLLLTQGLWNQGNGSFTLHAFAYDREGRSSVLGSKVITVSNATAVKPFGSIDVPAYGQTVAAGFWNFGWALTPNATPPCTIPVSGVQVSINSGPLQPVTYGDLRGDIAAAFPGFTNSSGAGGAHYIDTTALSNGAHQIGWFVVDNCGRQDGIGSRIFSVLNTGTAAVPLDARPTLTAADSVREVIVDPLIARRGFDVAPIEAGVDGEHVVTIAQGERIEVEMPPFAGATGGGPAAAYTAYQIVNGTRRALPAGSTFDADGGVFYWQPAPAFLGAFDLEFVRQDGGVVRVRVVVSAP